MKRFLSLAPGVFWVVLASSVLLSSCGGGGGGGVDPGTYSADKTAPTVPPSVTATPLSLTQISVAWGHSSDTVGVVTIPVNPTPGSKIIRPRVPIQTDPSAVG